MNQYRIEVLNYNYEKAMKIGLESGKEFNELLWTCINKHYDLMYWIIEEYKNVLLEYKNILFIWSCVNNQYLLAKNLYYLYDVDPKMQDSIAFKLAVDENNIKVVIWLYNENFYNKEVLIDSFLLACSNSFNTIAKILYMDNYLTDIEKNKAFQNCCSFGNFELAKWIYNQDNIDYTKYKDLAFRMACIKGHLKIAQWLYSLGRIDIHSDNDSAFSISCINGHYDVAKWVYSLGNVDIHTDNDIVFYCLILPDEIEIGFWLIDIGIIPPKEHDLRYYYQEKCFNRILKLFKLSLFIIKSQRKIIEYLYSPDNNYFKILNDRFKKKQKTNFLK